MKKIILMLTMIVLFATITSCGSQPNGKNCYPRTRGNRAFSEKIEKTETNYFDASLIFYKIDIKKYYSKNHPKNKDGFFRII